MADGNGIIQHLRAGLNTAGLRSKVTANNLANLNTPGFRRYAVRFEKHLSDALASGTKVDLDQIKAEMFRPMDTSVDSQGNDVNVDMEIGEMVKNSARYKTYMRIMTKVYRQMELAIRTD